MIHINFYINYKNFVLYLFLNSVFGNKGSEEEIVEIIIENSDIDKGWKDDKYSRLDIKAITSNSTKVNIEIQRFVNGKKLKKDI
ncbi:hypothetical protein JCM16358_08210 [Halanaerocella petrolearia]